MNRTSLETAGRIWTCTETRRPLESKSLLRHLGDVQASVGRSTVHSALVVGERSVGKSSLIHALACRLQGEGWTVFEAGASDLLAGHVHIGELKGHVKRLLADGAVQRRVLWYIPEFHELLHAGSHQYDPSGVLDQVLPAIEAGRIVVVGVTTPLAYEHLTRARQRVRTALDTVRVPPLPDSETLALSRAWVSRQPRPANGELIDSATLGEAFELVRQHLTETHGPGNLLHYLAAACRHVREHENVHCQLTVDDPYTTLSQLTSLPRSILDNREELDIAGLQRLFADWVTGYDEAAVVLGEGQETDLELKAVVFEPAGFPEEFADLAACFERLDGLITAPDWPVTAIRGSGIPANAMRCSRGSSLLTASSPALGVPARSSPVCPALEVHPARPIRRTSSGAWPGSSTHWKSPSLIFGSSALRTPTFWLRPLWGPGNRPKRSWTSSLALATCTNTGRWAEKRRMRYRVLQKSLNVPQHCHSLSAVSGIGAFFIRRAGQDLHVLEIPKDARSFQRITDNVRTAPRPEAPVRDERELLLQAPAAFNGDGDRPLKVVQRYRDEPSPLVRDSARSWRMGRLDRVLGGDFDLITQAEKRPSSSKDSPYAAGR